MAGHGGSRSVSIVDGSMIGHGWQTGPIEEESDEQHHHQQHAPALSQPVSQPVSTHGSLQAAGSLAQSQGGLFSMAAGGGLMGSSPAMGGSMRYLMSPPSMPIATAAAAGASADALGTSPFTITPLSVVAGFRPVPTLPSMRSQQAQDQRDQQQGATLSLQASARTMSTMAAAAFIGRQSSQRIQVVGSLPAASTLAGMSLRQSMSMRVVGRSGPSFRLGEGGPSCSPLSAHAQLQRPNVASASLDSTNRFALAASPISPGMTSAHRGLAAPAVGPGPQGLGLGTMPPPRPEAQGPFAHTSMRSCNRSNNNNNRYNNSNNNDFVLTSTEELGPSWEDEAWAVVVPEATRASAGRAPLTLAQATSGQVAAARTSVWGIPSDAAPSQVPQVAHSTWQAQRSSDIGSLTSLLSSAQPIRNAALPSLPSTGISTAGSCTHGHAGVAPGDTAGLHPRAHRTIATGCTPVPATGAACAKPQLPSQHVASSTLTTQPLSCTMPHGAAALGVHAPVLGAAQEPCDLGRVNAVQQQQQQASLMGPDLASSTHPVEPVDESERMHLLAEQQHHHMSHLSNGEDADAVKSGPHEVHAQQAGGLLVQLGWCSGVLGSQQGVQQAWPPCSPSKAVVFGLINAAVALPSLIALAAIVFKAPMYTPYIGSLCKFFFFASGVHQLVFVLCSRIPFAVGQIQDVGLIILSAMASSIASMCEDQGQSAQVALASTLFATAFSTLLVGVGTILVGKLRLAQLVQYMPLPVVGGYLAFVGYFCIAGGVALGCGIEVDTIVSWVNLFHPDPMLKVLPLLGTCAMLMLVTKYFSHPLALPAALISVPIAFYIVLLLSRHTLADAQATGWVMKPPDGSQQFWALWRMYVPAGKGGLFGGAVNWKAVMSQAPKLIGLVLLVCFGSCMDVAAVQANVPRPLDFNHELTTIGVSNCAVAVLGAGFTGSIIFSQTTFFMRAGMFSRLGCISLAMAEVLVFALPFSVTEFCPSFFFGALLFWFGVEICRDWLVLSYRKLSLKEYLLLWLTFALVMALDLEAGIALGLVAATFSFAYTYARSQSGAVRVVPASSGSVHPYEVASILDLLSDRVLACSLAGFIFFGSSTAMSDLVEEAAEDMLARVLTQYATAATREAEVLLGTASPGRANAPDQPTVSARIMALADAPLFVILGLRSVRHVDATGARTLCALVSSLASKGVYTLFAEIRTPEEGGGSDEVEMRRLLGAHGVTLRRQAYADLTATGLHASSSQHDLLLGDQHVSSSDVRSFSGARPPTEPGADTSTRGGDSGTPALSAGDAGLPLPPPGVCWEFPSLQAAVSYVEGVYVALAVARGVLQRPPERVSLPDVLLCHAREGGLPGQLAMDEVLTTLSSHATERHLAAGELLLAAGEEVDMLMLVAEGWLQLEQAQQAGLATNAKRSSSSMYSPGCWVLAPEFHLQRPSPGDVVCVAGPCMVLCIPRQSFLDMMRTSPQVLSVLQLTLLRFISMELTEVRDCMDLLGP